MNLFFVIYDNNRSVKCVSRVLNVYILNKSKYCFTIIYIVDSFREIEIHGQSPSALQTRFMLMHCSLAQIVKITISLSVLFTLGLAYYVPITVLWPMIHSRIAMKSSLYHRLYETSLRLSGIIGTSKHVTIWHEC